MNSSTLRAAVAFATVFMVVAGILSWDTLHAFASAPSGLPATVATTSQETLSTTALLMFATSTCSARIVSTSGSAVMLTFSDAQGAVPTGSFGVIQPASTTVAYDSGQYGCGAVRGISFTTQLLTLVETR